MRKLSPKREMEIQKSWEEYQDRLRQAKWKTSTADAEFRLELLIAFHPERSTRQLFNQAAINS